MRGTLERIWIKRAKRGPMDAVMTAQVVAGVGIVGNANQGGKRQVTLLSAEHWNDLTAPFDAVDPSIRRANLLLSGIDLRATRGKTVRIGDVRIRIHGETRPCEQMEAARPGLQQAMSVPYGGGVFGEVLDDGVLAVGDVVVVDAAAPAPAAQAELRTKD
jgi:MOSC domain-containing protein YiiM